MGPSWRLQDNKIGWEYPKETISKGEIPFSSFVQLYLVSWLLTYF